MASQMQDEALDLAQERGQSKPPHPGGEHTQLTQTRVSDKYRRRPACVTTPLHPSTRPPPQVLVVSPHSVVCKVVVDKGAERRRSRLPRS